MYTPIALGFLLKSSFGPFQQLNEDLFLVILRLCPLNRHDEVDYNESIIWNCGSQAEHNHVINTNTQFKLFLPFGVVVHSNITTWSVRIVSDG